MCARTKNILYLHVGLCDVVRDVLEGIRRYADIVGWNVFPRKPTVGQMGTDPSGCVYWGQALPVGWHTARQF